MGLLKELTGLRDIVVPEASLYGARRSHVEPVSVFPGEIGQQQ